jgi:hypothetical protein
MPRPKPKEKQTDFISRYVSSEHAKKKYPSKDQRLRVAYELWRNRNKKKKK